jgi:2-polyprenyl-3-methyl-5-hydroxy-6-metoxy-1,4-benzoquinol methylase
MKHEESETAGVQTLAERHSVEESFHDVKAQRHTPMPARTDFYSSGVGDEQTEVLLNTVGSLLGKRVLDFGCGLGQTSRIYAERGAVRVEGFDISSESIRIAAKNAKRDGLDDRVFFRHLAAEDIDYEDNSFDVVIGKAILHHTDLEKTACQLHRVLVPGGTAYFLEPLAHNPFLNLFRRLTPSRRTPTEKPLSVHDLDIFRRYFSVRYEGMHLFTLLAHFLLLVTGSRKLFAKSHAILRRWEQPVLKRFPGLQKYCWSAVMIFCKPCAGMDAGR